MAAVQHGLCQPKARFKQYLKVGLVQMGESERVNVIEGNVLPCKLSQMDRGSLAVNHALSSIKSHHSCVPWRYETGHTGYILKGYPHGYT